ncbi:MAG: (Fe-S)-binding protein [Bacillota bacterium]|nr:(Fe-S)-binding protein [Bacillota bacterium]
MSTASAGGAGQGPSGGQGCGQYGIVANVFERVSAVAGEDVRSLLGELQKCMRCGQCRASCPVFAESGRETDVARGKLGLLLEELGGDLRPDRELYARLTRCVNCGRCRLECPSGADTGYMLLEGRCLLQRRIGLPPVKAAVVRGLFGRPAVLRAAAAALGLVQALLFRPSPVDPRHVRSIWRLPVFGQRMLLPRMRKRRPATAPALAAGRRQYVAPADAPVVIYPGCLVDLGYPELLTAAQEVFARLGRRVVVPEGLVCCGAPAAYAGDADTARRLAAENLKALAGHLDSPGSRLAFLCPSCAVAFRHDYPAYLFGRMSGGTEALAAAGLTMDAVSDVAAKSVDATALAWELGIGEHLAGPPISASVTYHDPCHLRRLLGVHSQPREALRALAGGGFREAPRPDSCCGFGGTFALEHVAASAQMLDRRAGELASTGAQLVATACPGCMAWLANGLDRAGGGQRTVHLIELIARGLGGGV